MSRASKTVELDAGLAEYERSEGEPRHHRMSRCSHVQALKAGLDVGTLLALFPSSLPAPVEYALLRVGECFLCASESDM